MQRIPMADLLLIYEECKKIFDERFNSVVKPMVYENQLLLNTYNKYVHEYPENPYKDLHINMITQIYMSACEEMAKRYFKYFVYLIK